MINAATKRRAVHLRKVDHLTVAAIALRLGISTCAVRNAIGTRKPKKPAKKAPAPQPDDLLPPAGFEYLIGVPHLPEAIRKECEKYSNLDKPEEATRMIYEIGKLIQQRKRQQLAA